VLWAFKQLSYGPSAAWQHSCVTALRIACADACCQPDPFAAGQVGCLLEEAGLLCVLSDAVAAQHAEDLAGGGGSSAAAQRMRDGAVRREAGGLGGAGDECPLNFGFELPLGAA